MRCITKIKTIAKLCLLSFRRLKEHRNQIVLLKRLICAFCIVSLMISSVPFSLSANTDTPEEEGVKVEQKLKLYPNDDSKKEYITLQGKMPSGASADVKDVTKKHKGLVAYDITINDGEDEYQPGEENPIKVQINHPHISSDSNLEVWHIKHDGTKEQIKDFTVDEDRISFYATGFSVYEIVEIPVEVDDEEYIDNLEDLTSDDGTPPGFRLSYGSPQKYFTSSLVTNNTATVLDETTVKANAAIWYFEKTGSSYHMYTYVDGVKKYLKNSSGNNVTLAASGDTLDISLVEGTNPQTFYLKQHNISKWLQHSGSGGGIRYYTTNTDKVNPRIFIKPASDSGSSSQMQFLDGKTYGLFHYNKGATRGNALMADGDNHSLIELLLTANNSGRVLYVDEDNEIDRWKFTYEPSTNTFLLSTEINNETVYLCADSNGISNTTTVSSASHFTINADGSNHICLFTNGVYITFVAEEENAGGGRFDVTTDGTKKGIWFHCLDHADLQDEDLITFSADRISASDIQNGQKVIIYLRIWNEDLLRYDMYAVDSNGSLYPCYASGGKIMWLGDGTGSVEWDFTEYYDEVSKEPNYYYEFYNSYSEKYLAPQLHNNQILSDNTIGVNMPGRRNGDFFSSVVAWDNSKYAYIGFRPNADKTALEPCSESVALPLYFATREELNLSDKLHEVPTVDNNKYGIKMKMVNIDVKSGKTYGAADGASVTWDYFGGSSSIDKLTPGLLSDRLKENGYPDATKADSSHKDFAGLYANAMPVNHLFLERVYESSGYFEFDSCQNFATLKKQNEDGTYSFNSNEKGETDFTLYRELGTHDKNKTANSLKHGQFFPYDTIKPGVYAKNNSQNLYSSLTSPRDGTMGKLSEDDPRKYEQLHQIFTEEQQYADFYFGMEMEASFVQTPSGLDAWGHDIVFEFAGDDDFWLYVDDDLVLDLGGTHSALTGKINFRTGEVTYEKPGNAVHGEMITTTLRDIFEDNYRDRYPSATDAEVEEYMSDIFVDGENVFRDYSTHTMKMFYLERGGNASNLYMRFNIAAVTPGHVVVSKNVSGEGADSIDTDFVEYPFQIYYTLPDGPNGEPGEEHLLGNDDEFIGITYQNSNKPVTFVRKYRPPGFAEEDAYENIYFINPSKSAEIAFPDDTITYRIVECAVDTSVYGRVTINGETVPEDRVEIRGDLKSYSSEIGSADDRPSISFDNYVNENVIKDLFITKKLLDEDDQEILDDPETFNFRLHISSVDVPADQIPLTNMYHYYVLSPNKRMCTYNSKTKKFEETNITYSQRNAKALREGQIVGYTVDDVTFTTSGFGAISNIPAGYTICVPGLPAGSIFKVTEDVKTGYGLVGYNRVMGTKVNEDHTTEDIPSYWEYDDNPLNVGKVRAEENPQMEVINKKGFGINVKKNWSDVNLTTGHAPIYTAVYVAGELLQDSVKQIKSPSTSAYYFWTSLKPRSDGTARTNLSDYVVKEVTISNPSPLVDQDGTVSNYGIVTPIEDGSMVNNVATRTPAATPSGESPDKAYDYVVSTERGDSSESTRIDTITNTRNGGLALRLFKWDSDEKLAGGKFTLYDDNNNALDTYTTKNDGIITMMYNFERNKIYTLEQNKAPRGYVGIQKKVSFKINNDDTISMYYDDGTTPWGTEEDDDIKWSNSKVGTNGIIAFVDVYNKSFNFKIAKMDKDDTSINLDDAHFALYKQANTTISGYVKNRDPMTGFEDMVTENGIVDICGGNSGRVINPGENGSVYFLTETRAPFNYTKLEDDIIFRISPIGVPTIISDSYNGNLIETEDSFIYTLSVPNEIKQPDVEILTIEKKVDGAIGDISKDFDFTINISGAGTGDNFVWAKDGVEQTPMARTGGTFKLKNSEKVEIALPVGVVVTVTEDPKEYDAVFQLGDGQDEDIVTKTFTFTESTKLTVTNTLDFLVPTGVFIGIIVATVLLILTSITIVVYTRRRRRLA